MKTNFLFSFLILCSIGFSQTPGSGTALNLNSNTKYVSLNSSFGSVSLPVSISVWIKPNASNVDQRIFYSHTHSQTSPYRGFWMNLINGSLTVGFGDGQGRGVSFRRSGRSNVSLSANKWYHITGVINSATNMALYLNGVPLAMTFDGGGGAMSGNTSVGCIGWGFQPQTTTINAHIDELSVWNKALTQVEVRAMMCRKLTGNEPNLMAYYRFDNGTGTAVTNLVTGGPNGTLMNNPAWVASSAPVGDWSSHNLYNNTNHAIGVSNSGDSIFVQPANAGQAGTHVYIVNSLPSSTSGITVPPGVNYYFGVFNADYSKNYDVTVQTIGTSGFPNGTLRLAKRPDNTFPTWNITTASNLPNINLQGQSPISQFIIAEGCPPVDVLPDDSTACDSMYVDLTGYINYNWSNGSTSSINAFFNSGQVWVSFEDPNTGCVYSDTMDVTIINSSNLPSFSLDTVICGAGSFTYDITMSGVSSYQWFDGNTQPVRTFSKDGSYWFDYIFAGGCSVRDTLTLKFAIVSIDPVAEDAFYLCGQDTVDVQLRSNTYPKVLWSNGATSWKTSYWQVGKEWVQTQNADGCWQTDSFDILQSTPLSSKEVFGDTSFCAGESLLLTTPAGYTVTWPNGKTGDYLVSSTKDIRVAVSDGCTDNVEYFTVTKYSCECDVLFGDAFTPNGDGLNDYFGPVTKCEFLEFNLQVYNRWGQEVFTSNDEAVLFDGRWQYGDLPSGVYVYKFTFRTPYKKGTERGHVTLLR